MPWTAGDVLLGLFLFVGVYVGVQLIVLPLGLAVGGTSTTYFAAALVAGAASELGFAAIAATLSWRKYGGGWERLGVRRPTVAALGWAVLALGAALFASFAYSGLIEVLDQDWLRASCSEQLPREVRNEAWLLALAAVVVVVFAPPCEELFFRGFVFPGLGNRWGLAAGVALSAVAFSVPHFTYKSFVPIALIGAIFALTYWRSGNLLSTVAAHAAFNLVSIAFIAGGTCE